MPSPPFIIDAGPALNFLAAGHQRLHTNAIGQRVLYAPEAVDVEVRRKSRAVPKFKGAENRWKNMQPDRLHLLSDDSNDRALMNAAHGQ